MNERKKILVTGGLGYVGGRIVRALLESDNYEVHVTSRTLRIDKTLFKENRFLKLISSDNVFNSKENLEHCYECIIHLAAYNEIDCLKYPIEAAEFNIVSSLILLQKSVKAFCKQFIYFSTAHVYGIPLHGKIDESLITRPIHPYAITHKAFEDFVLAARDKNEIDAIVFRLSNSFGSPIDKNVNRWTLLINDLCKQVVVSDCLTLNSNGIQERDFITLTDVAAAVIHILNLSKEDKVDGLFNLGGNYTKRIIDIAELIKQRAMLVLNKKIEIKVPLSKDNINKSEILPLNFSSEKLRITGFEWSNNIIEEIDNLLIFCNLNFNV